MFAGMKTASISALLSTMGLRLQELSDTELSGEPAIVSALDLAEGTAFADGAESRLITAKIAGRNAVIFCTFAPDVPKTAQTEAQTVAT